MKRRADGDDGNRGRFERQVPFDPERLPDANPVPLPVDPRYNVGAAEAPPAPAPRATRARATRTTRADATIKSTGNYDIIDQLSSTAAKVSLAALLRCSPAVRRQLAEYLNKLDASGGTASLYGPKAYPGFDANASQVYEYQQNAASVARLPAESSVVYSVVHTEVNVLGVPVTAIVDSGASNTCMSHAVARELKLLDRVQPTTASFTTADGTNSRPLGVLPRLHVSVGKLTLHLDVFVTPANSYSMLLASDWLVNAEATLIYKSKRLYYRVNLNDHDYVPIEIESGVPLLQMFCMNGAGPDAEEGCQPGSCQPGRPKALGSVTRVGLCVRVGVLCASATGI